ncbi:50S ribosomal protein L23 [Candidatus Saccharibacteria bacterium]|nr:50S ribosomal protein L23 [Candidatus Saccharibacteria bacterium]
MEKTMLLRPRLSEKTFSLASSSVYVFDVPADANKHTVAKAVAAQFGVTVVDVNILNWKGKAKRTIRKGGRAVAGQQSDRKKAYVTLKEGESLPFFEVEDDKNEDKKTEKKADAKAASDEKEAKAETKPQRRGFLRRKKGEEK